MQPINMYETAINGLRVRVVHGDLRKARADIIVSPDDNHISGYSQLARAIIDKAGVGVQYEISMRRKDKSAQGDIVCTSGGALLCSTIIHAIVFDSEMKRGPDSQLVSSLTYRCLDYAERKSALSIAFPVLGGDGMSKNAHTEIFTAMVQATGIWCLEKKRPYPSAINIYITAPEILAEVSVRELFKSKSRVGGVDQRYHENW